MTPYLYASIATYEFMINYFVAEIQELSTICEKNIVDIIKNHLQKSYIHVDRYPSMNF